jgi:hypothetical protein
MTMTLKAAIQDAGKVSLGNGKMPGSTFALSATTCKVGAKLVKVAGSTCSKCYALKLEKLRPSVHQGWLANYEKAVALIARNPAQWVAACVFQINRAFLKSGQPFHRWFDSGDLQSVEMLSAICDVAKATPTIAHWLPTREAGIVKAYKANGGIIPSNLVVRVSSVMVDDGPMSNHDNTSTVHWKGLPSGHVCPASSDEHKVMSDDGKTANCADCRACWSKSVPNISYPLH